MPPSINQYVAENIRRSRYRLGYPQFYVSYKIGIGQAAYNRIEQAATAITLDRLFAIADILETDISTLLKEPCHLHLVDNSDGSERLRPAG